MAKLEDTEKKHNTHMVRTIRVCLYHTRMVRKIVPYAYGMYHTRMVHTIRVRYKIRIWYRTAILHLANPKERGSVYFRAIPMYNNQNGKE